MGPGAGLLDREKKFQLLTKGNESHICIENNRLVSRSELNQKNIQDHTSLLTQARNLFLQF